MKLFTVTDNLAIDDRGRLHDRATINHCDFCDTYFTECKNSVKGWRIQHPNLFVNPNACDDCVDILTLSTLTLAYRTIERIKKEIDVVFM